MNALERYITDNGLDEVATMNLLMEKGFISDNCVTASDVSGRDDLKSVAFLIGQTKSS